MARFERPQVETVVRHLLEDRKRLVVAVTGPRQTGKTTIIRQALKRVGLRNRYVAMDRPDAPLASPSRHDRGWLIGLWEDARREAEKTERGFVLALDEVQHVRGWSGVVKALWDEDQATGCPVRVIVSGSAPWSMLTGLHESMAGRFFPVPIRHWSLPEMAEAFDFSMDEHLFFGGYPGAAHLRNDLDAWHRYVQHTIVAPAIDRDIVALTRVDKPALMRRLMDLAPHYSGQVLSYNKMVGQLQDAGNTTTLARYLDLLSDAGLVTGLGKYSAKPHLGKASSPKLNVLNTALMTVPTGYTFDEARADRSLWGRIVESAIGAHLHNSLRTATRLHYWRHQSREVDFVLSRGPNVLGIEVKSGPRRPRLAGLADFRQRFPNARTLLVGAGGVPLNEFLSFPANYWLDEYRPGVPSDSRGDGAGTGPSAKTAPTAETTLRAGTPLRAKTETALAKWNQNAAVARELRRRKEQQYVAYVRARASSLAAGSCAPALLDRLARTYFGFDSGYMSTDPVDSLRSSLDSDEDLVSATLSGFDRVLEREDLPDLDEIVRMDGEGKRSRLAFAVLAGLAEGDRTGCGGHLGLTADQIRTAVGFYYLSPRPMVQGSRPGWYRRADIPDWYSELVRSDVKLVAEALAAVHISKIRRKVHCEEHLAVVARDPKYRELARLAAPSLFRAFPTRCTRPQILALRHLLWASVRCMPESLAPWVDTKLARSGVDVTQQALWLGTGMLVSPDRHLAAAMKFIGKGSTVRAQHLIGFLVPDRMPAFSMEWSTEQLAAAVRGVGTRIKPWRPPSGNEWEAHLMTPADDAANKARRLLSSSWLDRLAKETEAEATDALQSLASAPELAAWRPAILKARDRQAVLRRADLHDVPTVDEVQRVLQNTEPVHASDLAALLVDRLGQLATQIRDGNTNDWQQYWNVDSHGRVEDPRPEPTCRDTLLSALRRLLPTGVNVVDAQPEAQYAEGKRADIRVACDGHAVPVEIKKNSHRELWSAINTQLIAKYARAPESSGFGVYLVLWFGAEHTETVPPAGRLPNTPDELRQRLEEQVPPSKRRKIKVVVVDVSRPGDPTA